MRRPIRLAFTGDVMLGRLVNKTIAERGYAAPWGDTLPLLTQADLLLINLECALTARTERWHNGGTKAFYFRADPSVVETLKIARVAFAAVANNHIADFGMDGLLDTLQALDRAGIAHAGAGPDLDAARRPAVLTAGGWRIAVVAAADHPAVWAAGPGRPGINIISIASSAAVRVVEQQIHAAREEADVVVFSIHWGPNMRARPSAAFREFAHRVIEAGVDIFWGHSAHVVQGVEWYRERLILYDTGDFVDDYIVDAELRNDLSGLFLVRLSETEAPRLDVLPVRIHDMAATVAHGPERDWFARRFAELCDELGTDVVARKGDAALWVRPSRATGRPDHVPA